MAEQNADSERKGRVILQCSSARVFSRRKKVVIVGVGKNIGTISHNGSEADEVIINENGKDVPYPVKSLSHLSRTELSPGCGFYSVTLLVIYGPNPKLIEEETSKRGKLRGTAKIRITITNTSTRGKVTDDQLDLSDENPEATGGPT